MLGRVVTDLTTSAVWLWVGWGARVVATPIQDASLRETFKSKRGSTQQTERWLMSSPHIAGSNRSIHQEKTRTQVEASCLLDLFYLRVGRSSVLADGNKS